MVAQYIVIGLSPFMDTSVATGPFRSQAKAAEASDALEWKGWNTEVVELSTVDEIDIVEPPED